MEETQMEQTIRFRTLLLLAGLNVIGFAFAGSVLVLISGG